MDLVGRLTDQVFATQNLALILLLAGCIYLARQLGKERDAREAADKADRAYAEEHTKALYALAAAIAKLEGYLTSESRNR